MKVLVAYATRHGATQGIAERVAQGLGRNGLEVTIQPVAQVDGIEGYDAYVIGSAAYYGGWLKEATEFVRRHEDLLASRPTWLFSSGPIGTETVDAKGRDVREASVPKEFGELAEEIHPRDQHVFFGAWDPEAKPIGIGEGLMARFMRFMPAAREAMPVGDFRDWPEIEAWADGIAKELLPVVAAVGTSA